MPLIKPTYHTSHKKKKWSHFGNNFIRYIQTGITELDNNQTEATLKIGVVNLDIIKILQESDLIQDLCNVSIHAHGCLGNGLCQMTIGGASNDVVRAIHLVRERAEKLGGYAIIKHLPYSLRQEVNVWGAKPASHFLFAGIKQKIDPNRILNRNRFVEGI